VQVGQRLPADTTSLGRVLTAYLPGADDAEAIGARDNGYVLTDGLLETGLRSIGVPVRDHAGDVIASIAVAVNAVRVSNEHLVEHCLPHLRTAADHLSTLV
jgi:IclR family pca regulon transcriptional regulator